MRGPCRRFLTFVGLTVVVVLAQLGSQAEAGNRYYDRNGTISGFGVGDGGSYSWEGNFWNDNNPSGNTASAAWTEGDFPIFYSGASYTVTASASHTIAG